MVIRQPSSGTGQGIRTFSCSTCDTVLTNYVQLISKLFTGAKGRAFLFDKVFNVVYGEAEQRNMLTGRHIVRDTFCANCSIYVGWTYDFAEEETQKYKEGKHILEMEVVIQTTD